MYATIGRRYYPADSLEQVSRAYRATIEHLGLGASQTPPCQIFDRNGDLIGRCSYNGRIWSTRPDVNGTPLYDPQQA